MAKGNNSQKKEKKKPSAKQKTKSGTGTIVGQMPEVITKKIKKD